MSRRKDAPPLGLNSIGNKMLAALVAVAVLPAVTVSLYTLRKSTEALLDLSLTLESQAAAREARAIQDRLYGYHDDLNALAEGFQLKRVARYLQPELRPDGSIPPISAEDERQIRRDLGGIEERFERTLRQTLSCRHVLLFWIYPEAGRQRPINHLALQVDRDGADVTSQLNLEVTGRGIVPSPSQRAIPSADAIQRQLREINLRHRGRGRVLQATTDADEGEVLEIFARRIYNERDQLTAFIVLVASWQETLRELTRDGLTSVTLFDSKLVPMTSTTPLNPVTIPAETREKASQGYVGALLGEDQRTVSFASLSPRRREAGRYYVLAFRRPLTDDVRGNFKAFRSVFAVVLVLALALAFVLASYLARRLTRPLRELREAARNLGAGDLSIRATVETGDEVEEMASTFNAMADEVSSLYHGMERTIRDRTEQLQVALDELRGAHQQIVESERRYSDIVENASDMIQVSDAQGVLLSVNRRVADLFQRSPAQLCGTDFFEWVAPEVRERTRNAFESVLAGDPLQAFASTLVPDGDRRVPVEISATCVLDDGRPVGVRAILRDTSQRKEFEKQLIKAERLSSVGALAAGVAHEINNPLGIMTMFAQRALEKGRKGEVDLAKLEKIVDQAKRVAGITRGLLDFSRAAPSDYGAVEIGSVVQDTTQLLVERARSRGIELSADVPDDLPTLRGNAHQLGQVLLNLLLNSIQAVGRDGSIGIRAVLVDDSRLPSGGRALRVLVEDNGPGLPADVLPKLFEPFFTTKAPGEGTGLGLSVSYGILKEHQGLLWAENRDRGGARFAFDLPLDQPPALTA